jgi:hypothetical protein
MDEAEFYLKGARSYLESRKDTLWGRAFDVSDPKSREQAAVWLAQQLAGVTEIMAGGRA